MRVNKTYPDSRNAGQNPPRLSAGLDAVVRYIFRFVLLITVVASNCLLDTTIAQPPGTRPPFKAVMTPNAAESNEDLPMGAFMFLDDSGVPIIVPGMSFEEIDRLRNRAVGIDTRAPLYVLDSLDIDAVAEEGRCEMDVILRMSIESSSGELISIPLRMNNFHRIGPADITGLDEHRMTVAPDGSGYVLQTRTTQPRSVIVKMRVVARVASAPARSIDFLLPEVPSTLKLVTPQANVSGEVVGRGDEVVQTEPVLGGRTRLNVESGGGTFTVKWGSTNNVGEASPVVEVDSNITIDWDSPQDAPLASVKMSFSNLRESLTSFDIRLPVGAVLLDTPTVASSTSLVEFSSPIAEPEGDRIQLFIPEQERQQRLDLTFDLQLSVNETTASDPLKLQVPTVIGALRQRGEIQVRTSNDYRLRWRSQGSIQSVQKSTTEPTETDRVYAFRFERPTFTLPIWLSAKTRQLRLTTDTQISLLKDIASLEMTINATGQSSDGRGLQLDLAQWQLRSIVDLETGNQLDSFAAAGHSIELDTTLSDEPAPIRIRAEMRLTEENERAEFSLPRIVKNDDSLLLQSSTLQIRSDGERSLVVDLNDSTGLDPVSDSRDSDLAEPTLSRFNILPPDAPARVVGIFVDQPARITLASETRVELEGTQLTTIVDWTVSSALSLNGSLPIQFTSISSPASEFSESNPDSTGLDGNETNQWAVAVNGAPASLVATSESGFEINSENLLDGEMTIQLRHIQTIKRDENSRRQFILLPRPAIEDVSIVGAIRIMLQGDAEGVLVPANSEAMVEPNESAGSVETVELESLPREALRVRIRPRTVSSNRPGLTIQRAILRTAVGRTTRHEQLIATVQGDDMCSIELPLDVALVKLDAIVDGEAIVDGILVSEEATDRVIRIPLPDDGATHELRFRIWVNEATPSSVSTISPMMRLPSVIDRLYWQVVTPSDNHVIWAAPTAGRAMSWEFDRWRLYRKSALLDQTLNDWASGVDQVTTSSESRFLQIGTDADNRYLYVGSDLRSFEVILVSRGLMWLATGTIVLALSTLLLYVPAFRSPMTAMIAAIALAGLLVVAPDAAVLIGQLGMIASILVIVMFAIRALVSPKPNVRVLKSKTRVSGRREPSTRTFVRPTGKPSLEVSETQAIAPPTPTEVSP